MQDETPYPPPSPQIELEPGKSGATWVRFFLHPAISTATVRQLVQDLPEDRTLDFYDRDYPSMSDPGIHLSVQRYEGSYVIWGGNHGWRTKRRRIDEETLFRYLWACRHSNVPGTVFGLVVRQSRRIPPNDIEPVEARSSFATSLAKRKT